MSNNPASMTADSVFNRRPVLLVQNIDPASNRANHSHPWELATYINKIAGKGGRVPVRKRPFKRNESHYTHGPVL